ncbi:hypothetical protein RI367_006377 [Sorochytrium milnesiophthora]
MDTRLNLNTKAARKGVKRINKAGVGLFGEFKKFVDRGNVVDLAVGLVIGSAFTGIVQSLVNDIFTPILSLIGGDRAKTLAEQTTVIKKAPNSDVSSYPTRDLAKQAGAVTVNWGFFIQTIINFLMISVALFLFIQVFQSFHRKKKADEMDSCAYCLEKVKKGALRCKFCTSQLTQAPPESDVEDDGASSDFMAMGRVGGKSGASSSSGMPLNSTQQQQQQQIQGNRHGYNKGKESTASLNQF